jgi:hypothetical protein
MKCLASIRGWLRGQDAATRVSFVAAFFTQTRING